MLKALYQNKTLRLTAPLGRPVALALIMVIAVLMCAELFFRLPTLQNGMGAPTVGIHHQEFEIQLALFEQLNDETPFDCVFLGSSITNRDLNPLVFEEFYYEKTGQTVRCFNFGVNGGGEDIAPVMADILLQKYHLRLLIFGVSPRLGHHESAGPIIERPWTQYHLGHFNVTGWLYDHSAVAGYAPLYVRWLLTQTMNLSGRRTEIEKIEYYQGYHHEQEIIQIPLTSKDQTRVDSAQYKLGSDWIRRLDRMLAFHQPPETTVLIVEMPVHRLAFDEEHEYSDYDQAIQEIAQRAAAQGVLFWPTTFLELGLDNSKWKDISHLNGDGADLFTAWLADQISTAVNEGRLDL